jgi:DNA-binding GntR family transcriptional regulator
VEWAKLGLDDPRAPVLRITRVRHDAAFGTLLEEIVLSLKQFPDLAPDSDVPGIERLAESYGLSLGRARERISFVPVPGEVAQHLGIAVGTSVVKLDRTTETRDGEPVEWRVAYAWK